MDCRRPRVFEEEDMDYRKLGPSGTIVSAYCLGTMTFGAEADEAASHKLLDDYFAWGGNFIDTADVYSTGKSEEIIGRWLKTHPTEAQQAVIATKGRFPMGPGPNDIGLSRKHLGHALDASLRRLGVERIDLYQMHAWDALTPIEETLRFLDDAISAGKIGYYGFSNYVGWHIAKASEIAKARGYSRPVTLQPQYSLLVRDIELEIVAACQDAGMGLLPWSPLGGGWLTGKYKRDTAPTGATRLGENPKRGMESYDQRNAQDRTWDIIEMVEAIAKQRGVSMAQVALAWTAARPAVTSVILGARTSEQLADNLAAAKLTLSEEEMNRLNEISAPQPTAYPYGDGGTNQRNRKLEGGR
jgi:aryl-alcohol dehydrogenase-like predicted oxidoreductase